MEYDTKEQIKGLILATMIGFVGGVIATITVIGRCF